VGNKSFFHVFISSYRRVINLPGSIFDKKITPFNIPLPLGERESLLLARGQLLRQLKDLSLFGIHSSFIILFSFFLCAFSFFSYTSAQEMEQNTFSISASNQLEYSTNNKTHKDIFHNWTDLNLGFGIYTSNLRYEAHQPDDWGVNWQKLSFRNIHLSSEPFDITAGNYYVIIGRGLILRSYENRDLRYDNNLDGVEGSVDYEGFHLTLLSGTAQGRYERLSDPLQAIDGKISATDWLVLGGSYLRTHITDLGLVRLFGGNISLSLPHVDCYGEAVKKDNPSGEYIQKDGEGYYFSTNIYTTGIGLTFEFKDYLRFDFSNQDVTFNNPPALTREHVYTLLNRHANILDLSDEGGIQAEITTSPVEQLSVLVNYSNTSDRKERRGHFLPVFPDRLVFTEVYGETEYDIKDKATVKAGFSRMENRDELGAPVWLAPVFDLTYYLSERNSLNFILEHLWTDKFEGKLTYYDQILSLSFSHSPLASLTFAYERTTEWRVSENWLGKKNWFMATLDMALGDNHNLSLGVGSRRQGKVCSGGICVDKPALDGFEIKLLSRF
jgi:hypothetical protein